MNTLQLLEFLKQKQGRPIYQEDLQVKPLVLNKLTQQGLIYPYKEGYFLTQYGEKYLANAEAQSHYQGVRDLHQTVTPANRDSQENINRQWVEHFLEALEQAKINHPELGKFLELIGADVRDKFGKYHDSKEFQRDVQAIFNKWDFKANPQLAYNSQDKYNPPSTLDSIEHAISESLTRLENYSQRHQRMFRDPRRYREVYDKVESLIEGTVAGFDFEKILKQIKHNLQNYTPGSIIDTKLAVSEVFHAIMASPLFKKGTDDEEYVNIVLYGMGTKVFDRIRALLPGVFFSSESPTTILKGIKDLLTGSNSNQILDKLFSTSKNSTTGDQVINRLFNGQVYENKSFEFVNLFDVDIKGCTFSNCNMVETVWDRSKFENCTFTNCNLNKCDMLDLSGATNTTFTACTFEEASLPTWLINVLKGGEIDLSKVKPNNRTSITKDEMKVKGYGGKESFDHEYLNFKGAVPAYTMGAPGDDWVNYVFATDPTNEFPPTMFAANNLHFGSLRYKGKKRNDKFLGWIGGKYDRVKKVLYVTEMQSDLLQNTRAFDINNLDEQTGEYIGRTIKKRDREGNILKGPDGKPLLELDRHGKPKRDNDAKADWVGVDMRPFAPLKNKLENRFDGWQKVFFNTALREAKRKNAQFVYVPTSANYQSHHSNAPYQYYDMIVKNYPVVEKDGWWILDLRQEGLKIARLEKLSWQVQDDNFDRVEIDEEGTKRHYKGDKFHRLDGPAIENADGFKFWYQNGKFHRIGGPAIEYTDGTTAWYQNGKYHRLDGPAIEFADGSKAWFQNGKRHRIDGPAIERADGSKYWYINDKHYTEEEFNKKVKELNKVSWQVQEDNFDRVEVSVAGTKRHYKGDEFHRLDGPAIEYAGGDKAWLQNGKFHRLDGPAIERADGSKWWYQNGKHHRLDGPAIEYADGSKYWYQNGKYHRLDGPAIERADGSKSWWQNNKLHRLDGPAVEYTDGSKWWYINDKQYTEEEFNEKVKELNKLSWNTSPDSYPVTKLQSDKTTHKMLAFMAQLGRPATASELYTFAPSAWRNDGHWVTYLVDTGRIDRVGYGRYVLTDLGYKDLEALVQRKLSWQHVPELKDAIGWMIKEIHTTQYPYAVVRSKEDNVLVVYQWGNSEEEAIDNCKNSIVGSYRINLHYADEFQVLYKVKGAEMKTSKLKFSVVDPAYWNTYLPTFISNMVREQKRLTPAMTEDEIIKDAYKLMVENYIPEDVKTDPTFQPILDSFKAKLREEKGVDIDEPQTLNRGRTSDEILAPVQNTEHEDNEGAVAIGPDGEPIDPGSLVDGEGQHEPLQFDLGDPEDTKQEMINHYLDELTKAKKVGDNSKVEKIKRQIDELVSLSSLTWIN